METIKVPDVPKPKGITLCWKQGPTMARCDRKLGHGGPHIWEFSATIEALQRQLKDGAK